MGKSWIAALLAALTAFPFFAISPAATASPATEYRCLAVGIDRFVDEENTAPCSANNTEGIAALFGDCLPVGTKVTRRVNGPGSAEEMERLILDTFRGAGEEDTSYLYLSTHGVTWEEEGTEKAALILSDGEREEALEPRDLREMMDRSYFWAAGEETGTGYFTSALENALRAAGPEQIDPDGNGEVSLRELAGRIREIYGISNAVFLPEDDDMYLFSLPGRQDPERILGLQFDPVTEAEGQATLQFRFRTETAVRIEYRLVPRGADGWDFSRAAKLPDRERSGQKRGVLSPGEKERTIRVSRERLGEGGQALLQIVSFRGLYGQVPVPEATKMITTGESDGV